MLLYIHVWQDPESIDAKGNLGQVLQRTQEDNRNVYMRKARAPAGYPREDNRKTIGKLKEERPSTSGYYGYADRPENKASGPCVSWRRPSRTSLDMMAGLRPHLGRARDGAS